MTDGQRDEFEYLIGQYCYAEPDDLKRSAVYPELYENPITQAHWNGYRVREAEVQALKDEAQNLRVSLRDGSAWAKWTTARDAEVQALREALATMVAVFHPRVVPGPDAHAETAAHHNAVLLLAEYLPEAADAD